MFQNKYKLQEQFDFIEMIPLYIITILDKLVLSKYVRQCNWKLSQWVIIPIWKTKTKFEIKM